MDDFTEEQEDRTAYLQKRERIRLGNAEWIREVYPDYESLLAFATSMKMHAVMEARELQRLLTERDAVCHDQGLVSLLMQNKLPESALLPLVSRLIEREKNVTWRAVARSIALTRLQQKNKAKNTARKGGLGKRAKLDMLEAETLRRYKAGKWKSASAAAIEITPDIVAMSRVGNGIYLQPSTTKPLEWIRAHVNATQNVGPTK